HTIRTPQITDYDDGLVADDTDAPPLAGLLASTRIGPRRLQLPPNTKTLFTENETNAERVFGKPSRTRFVKDAFHYAVVAGHADAVNGENIGTKACGWQRVEIDAGSSHVMHM